MGDPKERSDKGTKAPLTRDDASWSVPPPPGDKTEMVAIDRIEKFEKALQGGPVRPLSRGTEIDRYRLQRIIGQGGAGVVYQAESLDDGTVVALKIVRPELSGKTNVLRRFQKEVRLMASINSPFVIRMIKFGEAGGHHFVVSEFVKGQDLSAILKSRKKVAEPVALSIVACVLRGLSALHELGIVHRDIKPSNILVVVAEDVASSELQVCDIRETKIADLGIARHIHQSESLAMTQTSMTLGTPMFMAPEQFEGGGREADLRSDLYAVGATLFWLLAGRGPFIGDDVFELAEKHKYESPPSLRELAPSVSPAVETFVNRMLAKKPEDRIASASLALEELERIIHGEPGNAATHPRLPDHAADKLLAYNFEWELKSSPERLWPLVSNTDRVNQAIRLPAPEFRAIESGETPFSNLAEVRFAGVAMRWIERPFEWIETRKFSVLREFESGPFKWFVTNVELAEKANGGATLRQSFVVEPRHRLGKAVASFQIGVRSRRSLTRLYQNIDSMLQAEPGPVGPLDEGSAFGIRPSSRVRNDLQSRIQLLVAEGVSSVLAIAIKEYLTQALDSNLATIRPLALARLFGHDEQETVAACLHSVKLGILEMHWDLICPVCRVSASSVNSLSELAEHADCPACKTRFPIDLSESVELVFSIAPEIKPIERKKYCVGGPYHLPHVLAQVRVAAHEQFELTLNLSPGSYQVTGPQLAMVHEFDVDEGETATALVVELSRPIKPPRTPRLGRRKQTISLRNNSSFELLARVERLTRRSDCLTAADVSTMPVFKQLFFDQLQSGQVLGRMTSGVVIGLRLFGNAKAKRESPESAGFSDLVRVHEYLEQQHLVSGFSVAHVRNNSLLLTGRSISKGRELLRDFQKRFHETDQPVRTGFVIQSGSFMQATLGGQTVCYGDSIEFVEKCLLHVTDNEMIFSRQSWDQWIAGQSESTRSESHNAIESAVLPGTPDSQTVLRTPMIFPS